MIVYKFIGQKERLSCESASIWKIQNFHFSFDHIFNQSNLYINFFRYVRICSL
jgi:hypothetical protein